MAAVVSTQRAGTMSTMSDPPSRDDAAYRMTPTQKKTFDELLAIGGPRPTCPPGLVEELAERLATGTATALERWTENRLYLTKSQLFTALRCEGQLQAQAAAPRGNKLHGPTVVGIVSHRAIQIAHTRPAATVRRQVDDALAASLDDPAVAEFWSAVAEGVRSDLLMQMVSKVANFLDSWPALDDRWTPRFEEPLQARVGKLTLSARADLVLGRPRSNGAQTMLFCDLKSGSLNDYHVDEGRFYALVATLRHGVPPFRSTVYSLASGDYSDPDVTPETLRASVEQVITGVGKIVDVLTETRAPELVAGGYCRFCPARDTCPANLAQAAPAA